MREREARWHQKVQENKQEARAAVNQLAYTRQEMENREKEMGMERQQLEVQLASECERLESESRDKIFQQNVEISRLEEECQNLILAQDQVGQQRDSVTEELALFKQTHLERMTLLQNELTRKARSCEVADSQLLQLQNQFVQYRDDKYSQEKALHEKVEELQHELKKERSMKDREIDFARLTAQTEKMSVKSACDVRIEILSKEKDVLCEEIETFKDQVAGLSDHIQLLKIEKETDPEKEALRQQIISLESENESKKKLRDEN